MSEGSQNLNNNGPWWKPAMQIFSEVSTWIAVPIILAVIGGKFLDNYFGTKPWMLLVSAGVAFGVSSYGIVKAVKKYADALKKSEKNK
jgi:F0F1-type ATP synthase assembly protein I